MTRKQEYLNLPVQAAKNLEIGDTVTADGEEYEVASILRNKEMDGAQVEIVQEDEAQTTIELGSGDELELSDEEKEFMKQLEEGMKDAMSEDLSDNLGL